MDESAPITLQSGFNWDQWVGKAFDSDVESGQHDFICWLFVRDVLQAATGIILPSFTESNMQDNTTQLIHDHSGPLGWHPVPMEKVQPFDLIVFRVGLRRSHVGVVVSKGKFLHAGRNYDSCIERYTSVSWRHRIEGVYRYSP